MNTKQEYKYGDMLKLADGSVVRFLERGGIPGNLIVQVNREGDKNIINEDNVVERKPRHEYVSSYARKQTNSGNAATSNPVVFER